MKPGCLKMIKYTVSDAFVFVKYMSLLNPWCAPLSLPHPSHIWASELLSVDAIELLYRFVPLYLMFLLLQ